jgi:hypothetical protein
MSPSNLQQANQTTVTTPKPEGCALQYTVLNRTSPTSPEAFIRGYHAALEYLNVHFAPFESTLSALHVAVSRRILGSWSFAGRIYFEPSQLDAYAKHILRKRDSIV